MTTIPINPAMIANAGVFTTPQNAFPINLCKAAAEGLKCLSMQFSFNAKPGWLVNFPNSPNAPMSQLAALFVDTTQSNFDVTVYFPDTGYNVRIGQGGGKLIPAITSATSGNMPSFYVLLDSNGALTSDKVNIIALNQFVPEFASSEIQNAQTFGLGQFFELQPFFAQSTTFTSQQNAAGFSGKSAILAGNVITATEWYITSLLIDCVIQTSVTDFFTLVYTDALNNVILYFTVPGTTTLTRHQLASVGGLNIISQPKSGNVNVQVIANGDLSHITNFIIDNTIGGGQLV